MERPSSCHVSVCVCGVWGVCVVVQVVVLTRHPVRVNRAVCPLLSI